MRIGTPAILRALVTVFSVLVGLPASADFAPVGIHHAPLGNAAGVGATMVSATGSYATRVPLDIPRPRGDLPDLVTVVHHGGNQIGEAGVGWSIPMSYVYLSTSISRRKPVLDTTDRPPRPPVRVFMSLGGNQTRMSPVSQNVYRAAVSESYGELLGPGPTASEPEGDWLFVDSSGRRYFFERIPGLDDSSLWMLTRVSDAVGNAATLRYRVRRHPDDAIGVEINLVEVAHSHLAGLNDCPKYRISLAYGPAERGEPVLGYRLDHGAVQVRRRLLREVAVLAGTDACDNATNVQRTYHFSYAPDADSGRPRLARVDLSGRAGEARVPVASYRYGSARTGNGYEYRLARTIPFPAGTSSIGANFISDADGQRLFQTTSAWSDLTGDGRPDFVRPTQYDPPGPLRAFVGQPDGTVRSLPGAVALPPNLSEHTRRELTSWADGQVRSAVIETWRQVIDWNGDGRMDIVDARGGSSSDHWLISLSFPTENGGVAWVRREVSTRALRLALQLRGYRGLRDDVPLPLSRAQTAGRHATEACVVVRDDGLVVDCEPRCPFDFPECDAGLPFYYNLPTSTVTEWKLQDVNGDGFPDFLLNSHPLAETVTTSGECAGECLGTPVGELHPHPACIGRHQCRTLYRFDVARENVPLVHYNHNGAGLGNPAAVSEFSVAASPLALDEDGGCGVERWEVHDNGDRSMVCGFREINGDGLIDRVVRGGRGRLNTGAPFDARSPEVRFPAGPIRQASLREHVCSATNDGLTPEGTLAEYLVRTEAELVDLTGDGIPDFVVWDRRVTRSWRVHVGTGVGFGPPQRLGSLTGRFEISLVRETCRDRQSVTLSGLVDVDGDGSPDVVSPGRGDVLEIQRIGAGRGALSAGRVTEVRNGYGGIVAIAYANAKRDGRTAHHVPFPEIVVASIAEIDARDPTRSLHPVLFAYGDARLHFDAPLARWTFPGYARLVTLRGVPSRDRRSVTGTAIVEERLQPHELEAGVGRYVLTGRLKGRQLLVGTFADAWSALDPGILGTPRRQGGLDVRQAFVDTNAAAPPGEECADVDPVSLQSGHPLLCRTAAVVWAGQTRTWQGRAPPPSPAAVERRSSVVEADAFGRPTRIRNDNDTARSDDDACVELSYATPVDTGLPGVLDAVSSIRVTECTEKFAFSGRRYQYDGLPVGQVRGGLPTRVIIERYNATTGANLGEVDTGEVLYDSYGNVVEVAVARGDGVKRTTRYGYESFGVALTQVTARATDVDLPTITTISRDSVNLLPMFVEDAHGIFLSFRFDSFDRPTRLTVIDPVDKQEYMLSETIYEGDDPADPRGRRVFRRQFDAWVLASTHRGVTRGVREATTVLDSFGRASRTELDLGADYGVRLVEGERLYDGLGRVRFAADVHVMGELTPYGTTYLYRTDGRLRCTVRGAGPQTASTTRASVDRYPTCFRYRVSDRQSVVEVRGPQALMGDGRDRGFEEERSSAIGWLLSRSRITPSGRIEHAVYSYDHLGQLRQVARARTPRGPLFRMVRWFLVNDSLGRTLSILEPDASEVRAEFDEWGSLVSTSWVDSTAFPPVVRGTRNTHDGFGRVTRREITRDGQRDPAHPVYDYAYDTRSADVEHAGASYLRGRLAWVSDKLADGSGELRTYFSYDLLGRTNAVAYRDADEDQSFFQRRVSAPSGNVLHLTFMLPDAGIEENVLYGYDSAGRVKRIDWKDGVADGAVFVATEINPLGRYLAIELGNGVREEYTYRPDRRRELLSEVIKGPGYRREQRYAGYDGLGRIMQQENLCTGLPGCSGTVLHTVFSYDAFDRLARVRTASQHQTLAEESFAYDALGNLTSVTDSIVPARSRIHRRSPDDRDRLCRSDAPGTPGASEAPCAVRHDSIGNITRAPDDVGPMRVFTYDAKSRLVGMRKGDTAVAVRHGAFEEITRVDASALLTGAQQRERRYGPLVGKLRFGTVDLIERRIPGPMGTVALRRGVGGDAVVLYVHADRTGNRSFSDANGQETQAIQYRPFGAVLQDTGTEGQPSYVRELWNAGPSYGALGVVELGARFYEPTLGRFLQRDPLLAGRGSSRAHPYAFAFNDPANIIDPSGLEGEGTPTETPRFESGWPWGGTWDHRDTRGPRGDGVRWTSAVGAFWVAWWGMALGPPLSTAGKIFGGSSTMSNAEAGPREASMWSEGACAPGIGCAGGGLEVPAGWGASALIPFGNWINRHILPRIVAMSMKGRDLNIAYPGANQATDVRPRPDIRENQARPRTPRPRGSDEICCRLGGTATGGAERWIRGLGRVVGSLGLLQGILSDVDLVMRARETGRTIDEQFKEDSSDSKYIVPFFAPLPLLNPDYCPGGCSI